STRKPRRRGYLPDAQNPVAQGRIERLTSETTLVEAGKPWRIGTAVQQDQQGAYRQAVPLEQGAIIQQKVGQFRQGIVAGMKVDGQEPIGRAGDSNRLIRRSADRADVRIDQRSRGCRPTATHDPILRREFGEMLECIVDDAGHRRFPRSGTAKAAPASTIPESSENSRDAKPEEVAVLRAG